MCICVVFMYVYVCVCHLVCVYHMHAGGCKSQKRTLDPLELELQEVVSHPMWVLGIQPGSTIRAANSFKY